MRCSQKGPQTANPVGFKLFYLNKGYPFVSRILQRDLLHKRIKTWGEGNESEDPSLPGAPEPQGAQTEDLI